MLAMPPTCHVAYAEDLTRKAKIALYVWTSQIGFFLVMWSVAPLLQKCFSHNPPPTVHGTVFVMTVILGHTLTLTTALYLLVISNYSFCYPNNYVKWSVFGLVLTPLHLAIVVFFTIHKLGFFSDDEKRYNGLDNKSLSSSSDSEKFLPDDKQRLVAETTELKTVVVSGAADEKMSK